MTAPDRDVILAIDAGTSGTRAAVVAREGGVSCLEYRPLAVAAPRPGVIEQDADDVLAKTVDACRTTIARAGGEGLRITALALATQRATAVLWDLHTGRALVPAMVWQDTRYAGDLAALGAAWDATLIRAAGRPAGVRSPYYWAARHLRETASVADALAAGRLGFGTVDAWLLWHLAADRPHVTTPTNATSAGAYVLAEHRYQTDWLTAVGFPLDLLPALREDADALGHTDSRLLGLDVPILASLGDQHAGAIGLGCLDPGQSMCIHGTGSFVDLIVGPRPPAGIGTGTSATGGTTIMAARRQDGVSHLAVETFVATTGSALDWVCGRMGWFSGAAEISRLAAGADSAGGATFLPALTGLRVPEMRPDARASLTGLSMASTREEVAYAVLEGIAHAVASCLEANEAVSGVAVSELVVGGGLAASDRLLQIQADLTGLPIRRGAEGDRATLRGAAYLAGSSGLLWNGLTEAARTAGGERVFEPAVDEDERGERRARWRARVDAELRHAAAFGQA